MHTIAIIGAMTEEVALIAKSLNDVEHDTGASLDVSRGTLTAASGETIAVVATVGGMGLVNAAATTQRHITGIIATGNYFVEGDELTRKVVHDTGADAVEMEGAAVAHVAARNDVPALVIRALSDNADTEYEVFREFDISEYADTAARRAIDIVKRL